jgi:hypothetical protein
MQISTSNIKTNIFIVEKNFFLSKKRNISLINKPLLPNAISPSEKVMETDLFTNDKNNIIESNTNSNDNKTINTPIIKKGKWSEEEDFLLMKYVKKYGEGNWNKIGNYLTGRTRKQVRQRYISNIKIKKKSEENNQNISCESYSSSDEECNNKREEMKNFETNIKFKWNDDLDKILLKEYFLNKKSWVKISANIPGSSENSVKNRFYSLLRQKVNKIKKNYKFRDKNQSISRKNEKNENNLIFLIKKEIYGNNNIHNIEDTKEMLFNNTCFESDYFSNKSKKKNYSVEILLEFLPELLEDKGIDIYEIIQELNERKNKAAQQIFIVIEKHFDCFKDSDNNDDYNSISTDIEFNLKNEQSEKLGIVIKNMKLKIMYKYFHRFRYNTLGI